MIIEGSGSRAGSGSGLVDPDPDPGGPKTCGSGGSGSGFGSATLVRIKLKCNLATVFSNGWKLLGFAEDSGFPPSTGFCIKGIMSPKVEYFFRGLYK